MKKVTTTVMSESKSQDDLNNQLRDQISSRKYNFEEIKRLIDAGANVNDFMPGTYKRTIIMGIAEGVVGKKDLEIIALLLDNGANITDLNIQDEVGRTTLHEILATTVNEREGTYFPLLKLLVEKGLDVSGKGLLAVVFEEWMGFDDKVQALDIIEFLLDKGAEVNSINHRGQTPLMAALDWVDSDELKVKLIKLLLERGAEVNSINDRGQTPLMVAIQNIDKPCGLETFYILLLRGANIHAKDKEGNTILHYAQNLKLNCTLNGLFEKGLQMSDSDLERFKKDNPGYELMQKYTKDSTTAENSINEHFPNVIAKVVKDYWGVLPSSNLVTGSVSLPGNSQAGAGEESEYKEDYAKPAK